MLSHLDLGQDFCSGGKVFTCNVGDRTSGRSSLGQEDPLEKGIATHSSILA